MRGVFLETIVQLRRIIAVAKGMFLAMLAGVSSGAYYEVPEAEKAAPKVKF